MNKSESKYFNTALTMEGALTELLAKKSFEYITVKEICERAGVNRSTFYLHYETVGDILSDVIDRSNSRFLEMFDTNPEEVDEKIKNAPLEELIFIDSKCLRPYLTFVKENMTIYRAAYKNPICMRTNEKMQITCKDVLLPILSRFGVEKKKQSYMVSFYIKGCMAIIKDWVNGGCKESVEDIEEIIFECVGTVSKNEHGFEHGENRK